MTVVQNNNKSAKLKLTHSFEVRNDRFTKSSYENKLRNMSSHFELLTQCRKIKSYTSSY